MEQSFLSDDIQSTLKADTASLPPDLLFISSKPKFIIQNVSLVLFLCELAITNEPGSQLMTLAKIPSLSTCLSQFPRLATSRLTTQGRRPTDSELSLFNATKAVHTVPEQRRGQIVT